MTNEENSMTSASASSSMLSLAAVTQRAESNGLFDAPITAVSEEMLVLSRIVIIDDDRPTTNIIARMLNKGGFKHTYPFSTEVEALEFILDDPPQVILLDIHMPKVSGIAILKFLKEQEVTRFIPVIVFTSDKEHDVRLKALDAGANDFINKPIDPKELVARVKNALFMKQYAELIKQQAAEVKRQVEIDSLTELRSRRSFDERFGKMFSQQKADPLNLILFDIDKFKEINDVYGHRAGDKILKHVADVTKQVCGDKVFSARIGGDEFAILFHSNNLDLAKKIGQRIKHEVLARPVSIDGNRIATSVSVGIASQTAKMKTKTELFDRADSALYESKARGRNEVTVYVPACGNRPEHSYLKQKRQIKPAHLEITPRIPEEGKILIVDDEPAVTGMLQSHLKKSGFELVETENDATKVLPRTKSYVPDLILMDVRMPGINGLEVLKNIRQDGNLNSIPVVIMTSSNDDRIRLAALKLHATDFLTKPVKMAELIARVQNSLIVKFQHDQLKEVSSRLKHEVEVRTAELFATRRETITCLARTAESRDTETGNHVIRVGRYAAIIAKAMGLDSDFIDWLELAAQLHDVGKIAIPDSILYSPNPLTTEERQIMETHTTCAGKIFGNLDERGMAACTSPLLQMAARIAATHHERWDGTGYPNQLAGKEIPLEGRITAVADVFDALSKMRPYKEAFSITKSLAILEEGRGSHFDPKVLDAFFAVKNEIIESMESLADNV